MDRIRKICPNCSQLYEIKSLNPDLKGKIPLFLSCGHSMCDNCIMSIVKFGEPIQCKVCKQDMSIDAANLALLSINKKELYELFPVNIFMFGELILQLNNDEKSISENEDYFIDLKELLKNTENSEGNCFECQKITNKKCQQCTAVLCDTCFNKTHKNFLVFKDHALQPIGIESKNNNCKIHKTKQLDYYCKDCNKSTCMDCMMVGGDKSCKNHNAVSVDEVNETFLNDLNDIAPKVDEVFKRLTKTAVDIGNLLTNIQNDSGPSVEHKHLTSAVQQHFSRLWSAIQKHKQEVMDVLSKAKHSEIETLETAKNSVAKSITNAKKVLNSINSVLVPNRPREVNLGALLENAKEIVNTPWYLCKNESNNDPLKVTVNEELCSLVANYLNLEGNADCQYKLYSYNEIGSDVEIPPVPSSPVYPPQINKDVRYMAKNKVDVTPARVLHKEVPTYRSKASSNSSLNSICSDNTNTNTNKCYVTPFNEAATKCPARQSISPTLSWEPFAKGSQDLIYISHIVDPHNFYVQRASHQEQIKGMLRDFRNAISLPKPALTHIAEGKLYLAFNKVDKMWQRCRIVSVDRNEQTNPRYRVFYLDFGSTDSVKLENLRLLPLAKQTEPALAVRCSLANCAPRAGGWTNEDSFLIHKIVNNKQAVIHVRHIYKSDSDIKLECDLTTFENGINLAQALVFHERARLINPNFKYPKIEYLMEKPKLFINSNDLKHKSVEQVYITCIVSPDKFFIRKQHLQSVYEKLCEDMEQEYSMLSAEGSIYLPEIGMSCAVHTGGEGAGGAWSRGVVHELPGRGCARVLLPDSGALLLLHWTRLKYLHYKFATQRALATECHLAGVTPLNKKWSAGSLELLGRFKDRPLELHVEDTRSRGSVGVTLYHTTEDETVCINQEMVKHKFAITFGLFQFNKNYAIEDQVYTNKSPLDKPKAKPKPPADQIKILKKDQDFSDTEESDLEAKYKGPLRLEAKVLYYKSPSLVYISLVHQQKTFNTLYDNMQKYYTKNKTPPKDVWKEGNRCVALCSQSQTWRRAYILEVINDTAKVFYSDFALIESVPLNELRELTPEFAEHGDAAIKCHLCGIMPAVGDEWPSLTKEYFKELLDAYTRIFITKQGNFKDKSMPVEMWVYHVIQGGALEPNKSEWRCLNSKIVEQGLGVPDKSEEIQHKEDDVEENDKMLSFLNIKGSVNDWLNLEPMPLKPLVIKSDSEPDTLPSTPVREEKQDDKISDTIFVTDWLPPEPLQCKEFTAMPTYIDNNGIIYLHDKTQQGTLDLIRKALDVRFKGPDQKPKFTKWTVGEPCIAMFFLDNRFYRGRVLEVNQDKSTCLIQYVDYGNEELCSFENMRKSIVLHQIPVQAHKCILNRIQPIGDQWDRLTLDYIHKSIVEKECIAKVTGEPINNVIPVNLKYDKLWINDHLVEFEMAVYTDGSKPVVTRFAPKPAPKDGIEEVSLTSDSGPDYIIEEESVVAGPSCSSRDVDINIGDMDWNQVIEDEENINKILTYPENTERNFLCNITIVNEADLLELNIIHDDETNLIYQQMYDEIKKEAGNMPQLVGMFEHKACIALFHEDEEWYRASVLEYNSTENLVKVRFVDYGNIEIVQLTDIKEIREEWTQLPPANMSVKLYGVKINPEIDVNIVVNHYTVTFLDKGPFYANVIDYKDSVPRVQLKNDNGKILYQHLIENGVFLQC